MTYLFIVNHQLYCYSNATALFTILVITIISIRLLFNHWDRLYPISKKTRMKKLLLCFLVSVSLIACTNQETKTDMVKIKAEIEALEGKWNSYNNARDLNGLLELYADDAVQLPNNQPMLIGKAAIQKNDEVSFINRAKGQMEIGQTVDVIGDENLVTEIGKATQTDSTGKVISIGKYMIVWKKINGKYLIIREMWNDDVKPN